MIVLFEAANTPFSIPGHREDWMTLPQLRDILNQITPREEKQHSSHKDWRQQKKFSCQLFEHLRLYR